MKRFLTESGTDLVHALWDSEAPLVTSWVSFAETSAAIAAARRSRRLSRTAATGAARRLESDWESVTPLRVDRPVSMMAGALAVRHRLRGLDAIHLASALTVRSAEPVVLTFDLRLAQAARKEGLAVAGA